MRLELELTGLEMGALPVLEHRLDVIRREVALLRAEDYELADRLQELRWRLEQLLEDV